MENISEEWKFFPTQIIPNVEDDTKPKVGQEFESLDATYKFYNDYTRKAGFSVRKMVWFIGNNMFVLNKKTDETWRISNEIEVRDRTNNRTGCNAKLTIYYDGST